MDTILYHIIEVIGISQKSWEDAVKNAVERAGKTIVDLRIAEVDKLDMIADEDSRLYYRAKVKLSFKHLEFQPLLKSLTN